MVSKDSKHTNTFVPSGTSDKIGTGGDSSGTVCVVGRNSLRSSEQILVVILFLFFSLKEKVTIQASISIWNVKKKKKKKKSYILQLKNLFYLFYHFILQLTQYPSFYFYIQINKIILVLSHMLYAMKLFFLGLLS